MFKYLYLGNKTIISLIILSLANVSRPAPPRDYVIPCLPNTLSHLINYLTFINTNQTWDNFYPPIYLFLSRKPNKPYMYKEFVSLFSKTLP